MKTNSSFETCRRGSVLIKISQWKLKKPTGTKPKKFQSGDRKHDKGIVRFLSELVDETEKEALRLLCVICTNLFVQNF